MIEIELIQLTISLNFQLNLINDIVVTFLVLIFSMLFFKFHLMNIVYLMRYIYLNVYCYIIELLLFNCV